MKMPSVILIRLRKTLPVNVSRDTMATEDPAYSVVVTKVTIVQIMRSVPLRAKSVVNAWTASNENRMEVVFKAAPIIVVMKRRFVLIQNSALIVYVKKDTLATVHPA